MRAEIHLFMLLAWFCQNDFRLPMQYTHTHIIVCCGLDWIITVYSVWCLLIPFDSVGISTLYCVSHLQQNTIKNNNQNQLSLFLSLFLWFGSIIYSSIDEYLLDLRKMCTLPTLSVEVRNRQSIKCGLVFAEHSHKNEVEMSWGCVAPVRRFWFPMEKCL